MIVLTCALMPARSVAPSEFDGFIADPSTPALIDFWASWCGPCKLMDPIFDELTSDLAGKVRVGKVNIENSPEMVSRIVDGASLGIPLIVLYSEGEELLRIAGACSKERLLEVIAPFYTS